MLLFWSTKVTIKNEKSKDLLVKKNKRQYLCQVFDFERQMEVDKNKCCPPFTSSLSVVRIERITLKNMKKYLSLSLIALAFVGCRKSLEERAAEECREFTEMKCPTPIQDNTRMDSMVFEPGTRTIHYYYTLVGDADNKNIVSKKNKELRKALQEALKTDTGSKAYKDEGFSFRYTYYSEKSPRNILVDENFKKGDY